MLFPWTGIKMLCLGFGALEGMAQEGAPIWHVPEKCPILAQRSLWDHALRCFISAAHILQFWHQSLVVDLWY